MQANLSENSEFLALGFVEEGDARDALAEPERGLERFGEPLLEIGAHFQPVHDRFDRVLALGIELRRGVELDVLAVDARAHETLAAEFLDHLQVFALAAGDYRREEGECAYLLAASAPGPPSGSRSAPTRSSP